MQSTLSIVSDSMINTKIDEPMQPDDATRKKIEDAFETIKNGLAALYTALDNTGDPEAQAIYQDLDFAVLGRIRKIRERYQVPFAGDDEYTKLEAK